MKKLILFSDGTGNSGGGVNSNVWRLYEAVKSCADQETFYEDGVGTQANSRVRAISGGTGIGIEKNVIKLYAFLMQQYEPGDQIYIFGFSRGAFTARVLANLLFVCGIADRKEMLPDQIDAVAKAAVTAYKKRCFCNPHQGAPKAFRDQFGLEHALNVDGEKGWFLLHFVGVWDTVEAYGLPVDELADALSDAFGVFALRFQEEGLLRENDLHPLISNAYHAIAIDDERHGFHPKMWIEEAPLDPKSQLPLKGSERVMNLGATPNPNQVVRQVWFSGMHSNVGGGYPQDQMAHVSLVWMMQQAEAKGLIFDQSFFDRYKQSADVNGHMYDSRAGTAFFYRYRPRDLGVLCASGGLTQPTIHESVFERIKRHTDAYAPTGVPAKYAVEPTDLLQPPFDETRIEASPEATGTRMRLHDYVDDLIWKRRVLYVVFVAVTLGFLWYLSNLANDPTSLDLKQADAVTRILYMFWLPIVKIVGWSIPEYFKAEWLELVERPRELTGIVVGYGWLHYLTKKWNSAIQRQCNEGWAISFKGVDPRVRPRKSWIRCIRTNSIVNCGAKFFHRVLAPGLLLLTIVAGVGWVIARWFDEPRLKWIAICVLVGVALCHRLRKQFRGCKRC